MNLTLLNYSVCKQLIDTLKKNFPIIALVIVFFGNTYFFWPGIMSPDSIMQYNQAVSGIFGDHHPPIMAVLWRFLNIFYPGPGLIFLLHLLMLYAACIVFVLSCENKRLAWLYVLYPIFPPIFFYSFMIWKDVSFAFSYLFLCSLISYFCTHQIKPGYTMRGLMALILFYGTAVKFQALFVAPIMILGMCYIFRNFVFTAKTVLLTIFFSIILYGLIWQFNTIFVHAENKDHSWKFVKIYDLAAISLAHNKPMFPAYILNYKSFSMEALKERFNYERVDDLVFFNDSPIPRTEAEPERHALLVAWYKAVFKYPWTYFKHRFKNWQRIIYAKPLEKLDTLNFNELGFKKNLLLQHSFTLGILRIIRYGFNFFLVFLCMFFYLGIGILKIKNPVAVPLLVMNGAALLLVLSLFPFCMASSLRYVYAAICLVHVSHPFASKLLSASLGKYK